MLYRFGCLWFGSTLLTSAMCFIFGCEGAPTGEVAVRPLEVAARPVSHMDAVLVAQRLWDEITLPAEGGNGRRVIGAMLDAGMRVYIATEESSYNEAFRTEVRNHFGASTENLRFIKVPASYHTYARDWAPILMPHGEFVYFDDPSGLGFETPEAIAHAFGRPLRKIGAYVQGGNLVYNRRGECIFTQGEFARNQKYHGLDEAGFRAKMQEAGCTAIGVVPDIPFEHSQHADMFISFVTDDKVLVGDFRPELTDIEMQSEIEGRLTHARERSLEDSVKIGPDGTEIVLPGLRSRYEGKDWREDFVMEQKRVLDEIAAGLASGSFGTPAYEVERIEHPMLAHLKPWGERSIEYNRSYVNAVISANAVVMPTYSPQGHPDDVLLASYNSNALLKYQELGFVTTSVDAEIFAQFHGVLHCITMNFDDSCPAGSLWDDENGKCLDPCEDGIQNSEEEGIDCGGSCGPCSDDGVDDEVPNGDGEGGANSCTCGTLHYEYYRYSRTWTAASTSVPVCMSYSLEWRQSQNGDNGKFYNHLLYAVFNDSEGRPIDVPLCYTDERNTGRSGPRFCDVRNLEIRCD